MAMAANAAEPPAIMNGLEMYGWRWVGVGASYVYTSNVCSDKSVVIVILPLVITQLVYNTPSLSTLYVADEFRLYRVMFTLPSPLILNVLLSFLYFIVR